MYHMSDVLSTVSIKVYLMVMMCMDDVIGLGDINCNNETTAKVLPKCVGCVEVCQILHTCICEWKFSYIS